MRWVFDKFGAAVTSAVEGILIAMLILSANAAVAQEHTKVGVTSIDCSAPTIVGTTQCGRKEPEKPKEKSKPSYKHQAAPAAQSPAGDGAKTDVVIGGVKESEVDRYLANYGKPPREAVRALLNPTDDNIAALLKKEAEQFAIVAYVAQRRTELTQAAQAGGQGESSQLNPNDLPSLIGMRVTVLVPADCANCAHTLRSVHQLVTEFPSVDGRIGVVGNYEQREFLLKTSSLGIFLPIVQIGNERIRQLGIRKLPAMIIGDTRFQTESVLQDEVNSALELEMKLVAYRKLNEKAAASKAGAK